MRGGVDCGRLARRHVVDGQVGRRHCVDAALAASTRRVAAARGCRRRIGRGTADAPPTTRPRRRLGVVAADGVGQTEAGQGEHADGGEGGPALGVVRRKCAIMVILLRSKCARSRMPTAPTSGDGAASAAGWVERLQQLDDRVAVRASFARRRWREDQLVGRQLAIGAEPANASQRTGLNQCSACSSETSQLTSTSWRLQVPELVQQDQPKLGRRECCRARDAAAAAAGGTRPSARARRGRRHARTTTRRRTRELAAAAVEHLSDVRRVDARHPADGAREAQRRARDPREQDERSRDPRAREDQAPRDRCARAARDGSRRSRLRFRTLRDGAASTTLPDRETCETASGWRRDAIGRRRGFVARRRRAE